MSDGNMLGVYRFESDKPIRVIRDESGAPLFIAADVCRALNLTDTSKSLERLGDDEKGTNTVRTPGGDQQLLTVNEAGIYRLIFTSRKPEAERFKRWLAHEVLPSIRKTGRYELSKTVVSQHSSSLLTIEQTLRNAADDLARLRSIESMDSNNNERMTLLEEDNRDLADRISRVEAKLEAITKGENYFTIVAWYKYRNLGAISQQEAAKVGREATRLSEERGVTIGKTRHPVWGEINTYHESILIALTGI